MRKSLLLLVLLASLAWAAETTWSPPDKSFSAVFPGPPTVDMTKGKVQYETATGFWRVHWKDIKPLELEASRARLAELASMLAKKLTDGKSSPGTHQGWPCVDVSGTTEGMKIYIRILEAGPRGYNLHCYNDEAAAKKFFATFTVASTP